jgi:hypothetical protein
VPLAALATTADLDDRNIIVPAGMFAPTVLDSASSAVREAAGCPISQTTSTVALVMDDWSCTLELPGVPVTAVTSVAIEGVTVTPSVLTNGCWSDGWRLAGNTILFRGQTYEIPATVTVVYTHGFAVVPTDIVDLVCGVAAIAFAQDGDYGNAGRLQSVRLGDFAESYNPAAGAGSPSPVAIPKSVRDALRSRFGTSTGALRMH